MKYHIKYENHTTQDIIEFESLQKAIKFALEKQQYNASNKNKGIVRKHILDATENTTTTYYIGGKWTKAVV